MIASTLKIQHTKDSKLSSVDFNNIPFGKVFTDHMYVSDYKDGAWGDMRIEPFAPFMMHPANITLHYGQAIFEGMKASKHTDGTPMLFRPELHSDRINKSAERLAMPPFPKEAFLEAIYELVKLEKSWIPQDENGALYLRPYMIAMDEFIGVQISKTYKFIIFACPVGPYYSKPLKLKADDHYIRAAVGGTGEAKAAGNYAGSLLPTQIANSEGFDQIMWLDAAEYKYIQEVGTMNIFFVFGKKIVTPSTDGAILRGITRMSLITIMKEKGYTVEERPITIDEVMQGAENGTLTEVFGSGTAAVVAQVEAIGHKGAMVKFDLSKYVVSPLLKDTINGLRSGRIEDVNNWTVKVV